VTVDLIIRKVDSYIVEVVLIYILFTNYSFKQAAKILSYFIAKLETSIFSLRIMDCSDLARLQAMV